MTDGRRELEGEIGVVYGHVLELLVEADSVSLCEIPQIEALLMEKVGLWQNELERCEMDASRAERRCELAREALLEHGKVDAQELERRLEREFAQRWDSLLAQGRACSAVVARQRARKSLAEGEADELRVLHCRLVRRLHPFLSPGAADASKNGLTLVRLALKRADLSLLHKVDKATESLEQDPGACWRSLSEEELNAELAIMEARESLAGERLAKAKARSPYVMRALACDDDWVRGKVEQIRAQIARCRERASLYQAYYQELVSQAA